MTAFVGVTSPQGTLLGQTGLSSTLAGFSMDPCALSLMGFAGDGRGPAVAGSRTAYPKAALAGRPSPGIGQEFYGHIIVSPRTLDLGLVLTAKLYTVGVWNLTGYDQKLLSWATTGLDGVVVTNSDGSPARFGPTAYRPYLVTVDTSGSATIAGAIVFTFEGEWEGLDVTVSGSRLIVFGFEPNWREAPAEGLEWLTDVLTAYNEREQRMALRQDPRRSMRYLYTFEHQNKVNVFQGQLWGWQQRVFVVPVWMDWQPMGASLPIGSSSIAVSTTLRDFQSSGMAIIWRDYLNWEIVEIASMTSSALVLSKPTVYAWGPLDRIIPVRMGRLSKTVQIARPTATIAEATVQFSLEVGTAIGSNRLGTSSWLQFQGLDVLTLPPNVANGDLEESFERAFDTVDHQKGAWAINSRTDGPTIIRPYSWLLQGRQTIMNALAFLETRKGRCVPFWMPSWSKDVEQVQDMGAADLNLVINSIGYTRYYQNHPNRSALIFFPAGGGTPVIKAITGSAEGSGGTEILSLDSSFGAIKTASDFRAVSFLTYGRMDQDAFEVIWHSDAIAELSFQVREVLL
jgi:hypothetical protein